MALIYIREPEYIPILKEDVDLIPLDNAGGIEKLIPLATKAIKKGIQNYGDDALNAGKKFIENFGDDIARAVPNQVDDIVNFTGKAIGNTGDDAINGALKVANNNTLKQAAKQAPTIGEFTNALYKHGTNYSFEKFKLPTKEITDSTLGRGVYLTKNTDFAKTYGHNIYFAAIDPKTKILNLNIANPTEKFDNFNKILEVLTMNKIPFEITPKGIVLKTKIGDLPINFSTPWDTVDAHLRNALAFTHNGLDKSKYFTGLGYDATNLIDQSGQRMMAVYNPNLVTKIGDKNNIKNVWDTLRNSGGGLPEDIWIILPREI